MKILAFDGTAKAASVALCDDSKTLASYTVDNGLTQSELLLPMAESVLKSLKLEFSDVDVFATSVGPGSFTGVRIGVSLVKGLAFAKNLPCVEVSTLEALAENMRGIDGIIVPTMDARRAQVYTAIFEGDGNSVTRQSEDMAIAISDLYEKLKNSDKKIYIVGDGYDIAHKALTEMGLKNLGITPHILRLQNAVSGGRIAARKIAEGDYTTDEKLSPTYLRMPQAERERLEKSQQG